MVEQPQVDPFVQRLVEHQAEEGLSDRQFAGLLGVNYSYLSYVKRGQRRPGRKLIGAACQRYNDLAPLVAQVWSESLKSGLEVHGDAA